MSTLHDPFVGVYITLGLCTWLMKDMSKVYLFAVGIETDTLTDAILRLSYIFIYWLIDVSAAVSIYFCYCHGAPSIKIVLKGILQCMIG